MKSGRCFTLKAERIAQQSDFSHGNGRGKRHSNAIRRELAIGQHLGDTRNPHSGGHHTGDRAELSASHHELGSKLVAVEELANLGGEAMRFMQKKKFLRLEIL